MTPLVTPAWLLRGVTRTVAGVLSHDGERLRFETIEGVAFDVPIAEVTDVVFPWYYFGGGCKLTAGGEPVRLSFTRPNDASPVPGDLLDTVEVVSAGRAAGRAWRERLTS